MQNHEEEVKNIAETENAEEQKALTLPKDVFISYSSLEAEKAEHIRDILQANGISCWMAPDSIPAGSSYLNEIYDAVSSCKVLIVLLSEKAQNSEWVTSEVEIARDESKVIIPYKIEDCKLNKAFRVLIKTKQYVEGFKDENKAIQQVMDSIHTALNQPAAPKIVYANPSGPAGAGGKGKWIAAILVVILAILGGLFWYRSHKNAEEVNTASEAVSALEGTQAPTSAAKVYYAEALPFSEAGFYESYASMSHQIHNEIHSDLAFSILSFVRNFGDQDAVIEKISCEIQELTPVEEPVLEINGYIRDNVLKVFLMNDGWGDARDAEISMETAPLEDKPSFASISKALSGAVQTDAGAGQIVYGAEYALDTAELADWAEKNMQGSKFKVCGLVMKCRCGEKESVMECVLDYDPETDSFSIDEEVPGGIGDGSGSITLFGFLDVDQNPSAITFSGQDAYPVVEDTFRIETVIVASKSCLLNCKGVYSVNGQLQETDSYNIDVVVPRFNQRSFSAPDSPLLQEIAQADTRDAEALSKIAAPYRYDAEKYLQVIKENYQK